MLKPYFTIAVVTVIATLAFTETRAQTPSRNTAQGSAESDIAFKNHKSDVVVTAEGTIEKLLPDDTAGDRHQRFIIRLPSGLTLLVTHNIDIAPRVPGLTVGATVKLHGEYVWNDKGGLVHWTHKDHRGNHEAGWIEYKGKRYD